MPVCIAAAKMFFFVMDTKFKPVNPCPRGCMTFDFVGPLMHQGVMTIK